MDVQIHGGFTRDGLAGRSPSAGAAAGAGVLVHSIACTGRGDGGDETGRIRVRVGVRIGPFNGGKVSRVKAWI
jgi:hypothetical protein